MLRTNTKPWFIYRLVDPRHGGTRYVGVTVRPEIRLRKHIAEARSASERTYCQHWIMEVVRSGKLPYMEILQEGIGDGWDDAEIFWIKYYRERGVTLTNISDGGQGGLGCGWTDERRQRYIITRKKLYESISPEERSETAQKRWNALPDEIKAHFINSGTPSFSSERRHEIVLQREANMSKDAKATRARNREAKMSAEAKRARSLAGWDTRRATRKVAA